MQSKGGWATGWAGFQAVYSTAGGGFSTLIPMFADGLMLHLPFWEAGLRLGAALVMGGVLGWERQIKGQSAGLRTHMLVSLGAAGFALIGMEISANVAPGAQASDLSRVIQAVATGIGFLGAGAIIQSGGKVKGLTTAANIWLVSAIGVGCGSGYWAIALLMTLMGLVTLTLLRWLEPVAAKKQSTKVPLE